MKAGINGTWYKIRCYTYQMKKNPIICYLKVFSLWEKKENPDFPFNWRTILNAFMFPIVDENGLAMKIEE